MGTWEEILKKKRSYVNTEFVETEDEWNGTQINLAIENQKLACESEIIKYVNVKDVAVDCAKKAMSTIISPNLVSFQTMIGPAGIIYWDTSEGIANEDIAAKTRILPRTVAVNDVIDPESFGQWLAEYIDREVFQDLINNAGAKPIWDVSAVDGDSLEEKCKDLIAVVKKTRQVVKAQSKRQEANWCVTSPTGVKLLSMGGMQVSTDVTNLGGIKSVGQLWDMKVYCDPIFPSTTMLMGYKGDPADSGYFYCPYILLTDLKKDDTSFGFITRYGKILRKGGNNFYAKLSIDNLYGEYNGQL